MRTHHVWFSRIAEISIPQARYVGQSRGNAGGGEGWYRSRRALLVARCIRVSPCARTLTSTTPSALRAPQVARSGGSVICRDLSASRSAMSSPPRATATSVSGLPGRSRGATIPVVARNRCVTECVQAVSFPSILQLIQHASSRGTIQFEDGSCTPCCLQATSTFYPSPLAPATHTLATQATQPSQLSSSQCQSSWADVRRPPRPT